MHANVRDSDDAVVSPDGRWIAFTQGANVYLSPLPTGGRARSGRPPPDTGDTNNPHSATLLNRGSVQSGFSDVPHVKPSLMPRVSAGHQRTL